MRIRYWWFILLLVGVVIVVLVTNNAQLGPSFEKKPAGPQEPIQPNPFRSQYLGFSSVFNSTEQRDIMVSFEIAGENSDYLMIVTPINWSQYVDGWEGVDDSKFDELERWVLIAGAYDLRLYISIDPLESGDRTQIDQDIPWEDKSFENPDVRAAFSNFAKRVAVELEPDYLTLGMEINTYYGANPEDFENFVSLYGETYDFVKQGDIKIGPTFQYDEMSDCGVGWDYEVVGEFDDYSDFLSLTTYPRICFNNLEEIPENYYSRIGEYSSKPIVIGESGWPTNSSVFPSSEEEQEEFLNFLLEETNKLDVELVIWWFMHDWVHGGYDEYNYFGSMGLLNSDGSSKLSWDDWQEYHGREKR
ncbi:MAG: hypothetical protein ABIH92_02820 [Nanoarchaeota archaeon]